MKFIRIIISNLILILILFSSLMTLNIKAATTTETLTSEQKAVRALATAYYNKGYMVQYCSYRRTFMSAPDDATTQNTIYSVCSDFTYSVYKNALNIELPFITNAFVAYGKKYYDSGNIKTNDVVEYWEKKNGKFYDNKGKEKKEINLNTANGVDSYIKTLLNDYNLKTGDLLCWGGSKGGGHVVMVYKITYTNSKPTGATIIEVSSKYNTLSNKITKGLSYRKSKNSTTGITEGAVKQRSLKNFITGIKDKNYFTIMRPILRDKNGKITGKYYKATFKKVDTVPLYECTSRELTSYKITNAAKSYVKYSGIAINKTVDKYNGSNVSLGSTLTYTIKIQNKSSSTTYKGIKLTENISGLVTVSDKGGGTLDEKKLIWNIPDISPGKNYEIKYKVTVNKENSNLGKVIKSTGNVSGIRIATIKNTISKSLNKEKKSALSTNTSKLFNSKKYNGKELIDQIYKETFNKELGLKDFNITGLILTKNTCDYNPTESKTGVRLNTGNAFSKMVLNNYYGALYTSSSKKVYLKYWEIKDYNSRDKRADTIYNNNFQTGDILIYKNVQTPGKIDNQAQTFKKENGTYYYIYISPTDKIKINGKEYSGFLGLNSSGNLKYIDTTNYLELQNLLAKDYYVILRPAQSLNLNVGEEPPPSSSPSPTSSGEPTASPSTSTSTTPSTSPSGTPSSTATPSSSTSPSSSSSTTPSSTSSTSPSPSTSTPGIINPSENYEITIESSVGMNNILIYKKSSNGKYILFYKIPLSGEKKYVAKIKKSMLNKTGKTQFKIVITETNGNREIKDAELPN